MAGWILVLLACGTALIPFFGFASWLIAGPLLFTTFILAIIVLSRGGTLPGIMLLLTSVFVAPVFIVITPFLSSFVGAAGIAAVSDPHQSTSNLGTSTPPNRPVASTSKPSVLPVPTPSLAESPRQQAPLANLPVRTALPVLSTPVAQETIYLSSPTPRAPEKTWDKPHIYIQLASESQRKTGLDLKKRLQKAGYIVAGIEAAPGNPGVPTQESAFRYFTPSDADEAQRITNELASFFAGTGVQPELPPDMPHVSHARQYEVWLSSSVR